MSSPNVGEIWYIHQYTTLVKINKVGNKYIHYTLLRTKGISSKLPISTFNMIYIKHRAYNSPLYKAINGDINEM